MHAAAKVEQDIKLRATFKVEGFPGPGLGFPREAYQWSSALASGQR